MQCITFIIIKQSFCCKTDNVGLVKFPVDREYFIFDCSFLTEDLWAPMLQLKLQEAQSVYGGNGTEESEI